MTSPPNREPSSDDESAGGLFCFEISKYDMLGLTWIRLERVDEMRRLTFTLLAFLLVAMARSASANSEPVGTFLRVFVRGDITGRTEVSIHKTYAGQSGPIRDIIPMQSPGVDGYPRVEVKSVGAVQAVLEPGRIVIESTENGQGEVDIFIIHNSPQSTWWLQMKESPGVGTLRTNVVVEFPNGVRVDKHRNGLTVQLGYEKQELLQRQFNQSGWQANVDRLPEDSNIWLNVNYQPVRLAPLWVAQLSLLLASLSVVAGGYLLWKSRQRRSLEAPPHHTSNGT